MSKSIFSAPHFNDEAAAYAFVEKRLWADGRPCPHCGVLDRSGALKGKSNRPGLYKCYACRKPFTVKIGTIFEASHIAMRDWLTAIHLICSSKKGISANQLHRTLGITLKSAWFMAHRIRLAMTPGSSAGPLGGEGMTVEADETYFGPIGERFVNGKGWRKKMGHGDKLMVVSLVERGGRARSVQVKAMTAENVRAVVLGNVARESALMTDEALFYPKIGREFASHGSVKHKTKQYRSGDAYTNTVEGFFSIFKRGMKGVYQHCDEKHLHRYLAEFDFRYNERAALGADDTYRSEQALIGVKGKRLTYRTTSREMTA